MNQTHMKKVVFSGYWGSSKARDLLAYPHDWVGARFADPLLVLKQKGQEAGFDMYGEEFGDYKDADIFVFWERPKPGNEMLRYALAAGKPRILLVTEPSNQIPLNADPTNEVLFDEIFSWYGPEGGKYHRIRPITFAFPEEISPVPFEDRKLSVMIASIYTRDNDPGELYSKRAETVRWFEAHHPEDLDFYGRQNRYTDTRFKNYKGPVDEKMPVLERYRFQICYENTTSLDGYVSEKIFDAFFAGCIPVYLGCKDIENFIPKDCYVDRRDFESYEALYDFMTQVDEKQYQQYRANIDRFLQTDFAKSYNENALSEAILPVLKKY